MAKRKKTVRKEASPTNAEISALMSRAFCQPLKVLGHTESSLSAFSVFWAVAFNPGRTQIEVAEATGLSAKTVSRVLSQLGETRTGREWIRQVPDDNDRRVRRLQLTRKGKSVHTRLLRDLRRVVSAS